MTRKHLATNLRMDLAILSAGMLLMTATNIVAQTGDAPDENLLLQDSFEEGDREPEHWHEGAAIPGVKYAWDRKLASEGSSSLSLRKRAKRYFPIAEWSRTLEHTGELPAVEVKVKVKALNATKATVDVVFLDENQEWIRHEWAAYIGAKQGGDPPARHDWKEYSGVVSIPPNTTAIRIGLQIYGPGAVWFDELTVRYVEPNEKQADAGDSSPSHRENAASDATPADAIPVRIGADATGHYLFCGSPEPAPAQGYGLLVVLPGGAGDADFHPFVRRIGEQALGKSYVVAQPLASGLRPMQIVWPTAENRLDGMAFTTEQLVEAVIDDVEAKQSIDESRIFLLGWSSGGPPVYASALQESSKVAGALIAMSVFKPDALPALENARGRRYYLLHSPQDKVCPYWMAERAKERLAAVGAEVHLTDYSGGHGWHGDVYGMIRHGVAWLAGGVD